MFGWISAAFGAITDWALTALGSREIEPPMTGAMRAFLLGDANIAALCPDADMQFRPLVLPQKPVLPTVVIRRVSEVRGAHLRGVNGLSRARYQVDCCAKTHDGASALGSYVARRLSGFSGTWTTTSSPSQEVRVTVLPEMEQDILDPEISPGLFRHSADYFLYHRLAS